MELEWKLILLRLLELDNEGLKWRLKINKQVMKWKELWLENKRSFPNQLMQLNLLKFKSTKTKLGFFSLLSSIGSWSEFRCCLWRSIRTRRRENWFWFGRCLVIGFERRKKIRGKWNSSIIGAKRKRRFRCCCWWWCYGYI